MNKMKKLLSVVLAIVMALSCMSMTASAAKAAYQSVDELKKLDAYSDYGQVTRLSTEERMSITLDFLDTVLNKANINPGEIFNILGLSLSVDLRSINGVCKTLDQVKDLLGNTLVSLFGGLLGVLGELSFDSWPSGMTREKSDQLAIIRGLTAVLNENKDVVYKIINSGELNLGSIIGNLVNLGDIGSIIGNIPGLIKGLVYPMIERWDDTLTLIKDYDNSIAGTGKNVEAIANMRVQKLFSDNMSITTIKYDANGNMTSEHKKQWLATATGSAAPGTPSANSPRCYYQFSSTTPGSVMTVYHIVDAAEAKALAKTPDAINGSPAAYTYFKEKQTFVMSKEVEGSDTYVWKATDEFGNTWSLKWYNDESPLLPGAPTIDLSTMSAGELLYKFIPVVFKDMAPVVLNGSVKKLLAEFVGVKFTYVGEGGPEADDAVKALPDASNAFFTEEQGEYLWEWSNYAVINGTHYYRFEDQIFVGDLSDKNNYFDIINWNFKVTEDFMNEFVPDSAASADTRLLQNVTKFLNKVGNLVLKESADTADTRTDYTAKWTRPKFADGNANLVNNIKALAQAIVGLAPQHIFGDDWKENERCYASLMLANTGVDGAVTCAKDDENDVILTGIATHLVNMLMPSMSLPGKSDILNSGAKVGAILAAVVREFAAYLAPEYNFDALIYTSFENGTKKFVTGKDSGYWFDVILTMGINIGFEYLRAFSDMGEGTAEWDSFVSYSGYGEDGKTYAAGTTQADLNAEWEGMLDYIIDWALDKDYEWCWKFENIVNTTGLTIDLETAQDPFVKIQQILGAILPVDEILTVTPAEGESKFEHWLRQDLILGIVDLKWDHLIDTIQFNGPKKYFRTDNVLDQLAALLKSIVNPIFAKVGGGSYALIPSSIGDFDALANQQNLATMVKDLLGALNTAVQNPDGSKGGLLDTVLPFLGFLLGWKTDPQKIADPEIWASFRDGNDYAFQWDPSTQKNSVSGATMNATYINVLNNSAGMLEKHRNSSVTDSAYDIKINSVTSDAKVNALSFSYVTFDADGNEVASTDNIVSPYETVVIKVGGTYKGDEAVTVTIKYEYTGKDGKVVGGEQTTSYSFFISNLYEDANIDGRFAGDDDTDYAGINQYKRYQFTEDIFTTVTSFKPEIFATVDTAGGVAGGILGIDDAGTKERDRGALAAPDYDQDCNKNKTYYNLKGHAPDYFEFITDPDEAGWPAKKPKKGTISGYLYKAKAGVTAKTFSEENSEKNGLYGTYDMGRVAVAYGSDNKQWRIIYIYYNDYNAYDIYLDNRYNGYNASQVTDESIYNEYNAAWKEIVRLATYPMMTNEATALENDGFDRTNYDYVSKIQPQIPAAIERFEAAKEAFEKAKDSAASGASAALPKHVVALQEEIDNDFDANKKEINFQDYEFYEYFNYQDVKVAAENLYRTYLAPKVMDQYYIMGSGISQAELDLVMDAEANSFIAEGIAASRKENSKDAIDASQEAYDTWKMPVTTKLVVDDTTARLAFYKQFVIMDKTREANDHLKFLEKEISFVENQNLDSSKYTEASWANYDKALKEAKKVADGTDEFANYNSRIYDVKYNLMVAYKNLLLKKGKGGSLIEQGGTSDLLANIEIANNIFASLAAGDGKWSVAPEFIEAYNKANEEAKEGDAEKAAYAALISALGYEYQARYSSNDIEVQNGKKQAGDLKTNADGSPMMFYLYADSALEYAKFDRPNNSGNQAKVNAANKALADAIANFEGTAPAEPNTLVLNENAPFEAIIDLDNNIGGEYTGTVYGFDTLGWNEDWTVDGTIADFVTTAYGDDYLEVIVPDSAGVETTGTVINVLDEEGNVVESYIYVYYGDIDMDGNVGESDAGFAAAYQTLYEGFDTLHTFMAGDLDYDAVPGESDAGFMAAWETLYEGMPYQSDVGAGVYGSIVYEIF